MPADDLDYRCFYCREVFSGYAEALKHFGPRTPGIPACLKDEKKLEALIRLAVRVTMCMATEQDIDPDFPGYDGEHDLLCQEVVGSICGISDCSEDGPALEWQAFFQS